jgi:hypothetical protein
MSYQLIKDAYLRQAQKDNLADRLADPETTKAAYAQHFDRMSKDQGGGLMDIPQPAQGDSEQAGVYNALTQSPQTQQPKQQEPEKPIDRWKRGIESLLTSGNPTLVSQGESMLNSYHSRMTQAPTAPFVPKVSAYGQQAMDMGFTPGTAPFRQKVERLATEGRITHQTSDQKSGPVSAEDAAILKLDPDSQYFWSSDGSPKPIKTSSYTDAQLKAAGYGERMGAAESELTELMDSGFDPTTYQQKIGESIPGSWGHKYMTEQQKLYTNAKIDWVRAKLRHESGAVIGKEEALSEANAYFPAPGDPQRVIEQKARLRRTAMRSIGITSGGKYKVPKKKKLPPLPEGVTFVD